MSGYCCFTCPQKNLDDRQLSDLCDVCGRPLGFPLQKPPVVIGEYKIVLPIDRGFYSATYVAVRGRLEKKVALKVAPKAIYEFFKKDFVKECEQHAALAEGTQHIVGIDDYFEVDVVFGDISIPCYICVLEYVEGASLSKYLRGELAISARTLAQIAIDLFQIRRELVAKNLHHNDLHAGNLIVQDIGRDARRADAIDDSHRVIAIDLGSVLDASRSGERKDRLGDLHRIGQLLSMLTDLLLQDPDEMEDVDYRLAESLREISQYLLPAAEKQRTPENEDFIRRIKESFEEAAAPWHAPLKLHAVDDSYNAQTLAPWHIPSLLVDPEEKWLAQVSTHGPQIISGMRGCGKTMLLRAMQLLARAALKGEESAGVAVNRIKSDRYVGLYTSTVVLLDQPGTTDEALFEPYTRLLVYYAMDAIQALRRMAELDRAIVNTNAHSILAEAIQDYLQTDQSLTSALSLTDLRYKLIREQVALSNRKSGHQVTAHPSSVFPHLAEALKRCCTAWEDSQILFLLDDVSTRYLTDENISRIFSALLFQHPSCAFKLTSETQTLKLALYSPGQVEKASAGRDYKTFDLGAAVYTKITDRRQGEGKEFVSAILRKRALYHPDAPKEDPLYVLGDSNLKSIAQVIAESSSDARARKEVYHGLTALTRLCVGDLGDLVSLYEEIVKNSRGQYPVPKNIQSDCFQQISTRRLYDLDHRAGELKQFALSFAEASHKLLLQSHEDLQKGGGTRKRLRLRQYSQIYVRVTTGDTNLQLEKLRDLIDAGVFVFAGGSDVPRAKTRDADPVQQFKLTYRKIYGLGKFIGLAESDRFELSGDELNDWLLNPSKGTEILSRNLMRASSSFEEGLGDEDSVDVEPNFNLKSPEQLGFDDQLTSADRVATDAEAGYSEVFTQVSENTVRRTSLSPQMDSISAQAWSGGFYDTIILGLGFEDRTLESAKVLEAKAKAKKTILVSYSEPGHSHLIRKIAESISAETIDIPYDELASHSFASMGKNVLVDITGLAKPALFHAIRRQLIENKQIDILHTHAEAYYPLDADLRDLVIAEREQDYLTVLDRMRKVLTGEAAPYTARALLRPSTDLTRPSVLLGFASAKHERLLSLIDRDEYDALEIIAPNTSTPRSSLANMAAKVAAGKVAHSEITRLPTDSVDETLNQILGAYDKWHRIRGANFEVGLTGSKAQGVATAIASSVVKFGQCWYLQPSSFDAKRFTKGVGSANLYSVKLE